MRKRASWRKVTCSITYANSSDEKTDPIRLLRQMAPAGLKLETLVHVGAHLAQERHSLRGVRLSARLMDRRVPEVYGRLSKVLERHQGTAQHEACCALLTGERWRPVGAAVVQYDGKSI